MEPHIKDFFNFLEEKENKPIPFTVKLLNPDDFKLSPEDLNVKGYLNLAWSRIKQLPDNLQVGGSLYLYDTSIRKLPNGLQVGENLLLDGSTIEQLPNNLKVEGSLDLVNTPISKTMSKEQIRKEIEQKGGYVRGTIYI